MKKIFSVIIITVLITGLVPSKALADIEGVSAVLESVDNGVDKVSTVYKRYETIYQSARKAITGTVGAIKKTIADAKKFVADAKQFVSDVKGQINEVKEGVNSVKDGIKDASNQIGAVTSAKSLDDLEKIDFNVPSLYAPKFVLDLNNTEQTTQNIKDNYVPKYGQGNDQAVYLKQRSMIENVQRENVAATYAYAFVNRVNLPKEETEDKTQADQRAVIQDTNAEYLKTTERLARIAAMNAMLEEFRSTEQIRTIKSYGEGE